MLQKKKNNRRYEATFVGMGYAGCGMPDMVKSCRAEYAGRGDMLDIVVLSLILGISPVLILPGRF